MATNDYGHLITPSTDTKLCYVKTVNVDRTYTTPTIVAQLPRGSRILGLLLNGTASNASLTATLSVGTTTNVNELVTSENVLTANGTVLLTTGPTQVGIVQTAAITNIYVEYAETGTASTQGSWQLSILYSLAD